MGTDQSKTVIMKFADFGSADRALRNLRRQQKAQGLGIRQGAVVVGTPSGMMPVKDIDDIGLGEVTGSAADLMVFLGVGTAKIAAETAFAGVGLLLNSARRAAALGVSLLLMPARMVAGAFESDSPLQGYDTVLEAGACAVFAVVDAPEDAELVIADLADYGGEVIQVGLNE